MNAHHIAFAIRLYGAALAIGLLAGCQQPAPRLEENFGKAARQAVAQQILNPAAVLDTEPVNGLDGPAAKHTMDRYEKSFETPPRAINVINIGGGIAGGGAGGAGK